MERRRRRPAVSCTLCRRRKLRCNRENPCSNCLRSRTGDCVYENPTHQPVRAQAQPKAQLQQQQQQQQQLPNTIESSTSSRSTIPSHPGSTISQRRSNGSTTPTTQSSIQDTESLRLKLRIRQLEDELSKLTCRQSNSPLPTGSPNIETVSTRLGGAVHIHREHVSGDIARHVSHKSRVFGQSHWIVGGVLMIRKVFDALEALRDREDAVALYKDVDKCKAMARTIKAKRAPAWPCAPTTDLPIKEVADTLVENYLKTSESILRILHIPSFRSDYEALWVSNSPPSMAFIIQLKLVLAIGAVTFDEFFTMRKLAVHWVYEAHSWVSEPKFKSRLDIQSLQTQLLLLIAQEKVGVSGDPLWISIGSLIRKATFMGVHRDPTHLRPRTVFAAEMRRRLWNTILELSLQSSLDCGGPVLLGLSDFDSAPPQNFDDDQLVSDESVPKPEDEFTQSSISIALRKTFSQRLAVVKFLNDIASAGTYDEALQIDTQLRDSYKSLVKSLQAHKRSSCGAAPSQYEHRVVDVLIHRFLAALHIPYFSLAIKSTDYAFSRKVVVDSSVRIWNAVFPPDGKEDDDLAKLAVCSSGFYPVLINHSALLVAVELHALLAEEEGLSPTPLRPDLVAILTNALPWCHKLVQAGETNIKGYILTTLLTADLEASRLRLSKEETGVRLVQAASKTVQSCIPILQGMIDALGGEPDVPPQQPFEELEDWGFMTSELMFTPGSEPMTWMMDDVNIGGPALW